MSRDQARFNARAGIALLARAFNHCGGEDQGHRYAEDVQGRFLELVTELVGLVEHGDIENNPAHAQHLKVAAARNDRAVQALIRGAQVRRTLKFGRGP